MIKLCFSVSLIAATLKVFSKHCMCHSIEKVYGTAIEFSGVVDLAIHDKKFALIIGVRNLIGIQSPGSR